MLAAENKKFPFVSESLKGPRIRAIQAIVARAFKQPTKIMRSKQKPADMAWPRQIAMALCRELTGASLPMIGREFGGRDHGTVLHAIKTVRDRCEVSPKYHGAVVNELRDFIRKNLKKGGE